MITFTQKIPGPSGYLTTLTLAWQQRLKSRLRVVLDNGAAAGIFLSRGTVLRGGDLLLSEEGEVVLVQAESEMVSIVTTDNPLLLARICYHLGNRHVALQIDEGRAGYLHDHVLDDMVRGLGAHIHHDQAPFEPEFGAYAGHGHSHD